jgi:RNA polymerase sigma factor (sigma-70 family)
VVGHTRREPGRHVSQLPKARAESVTKGYCQRFVPSETLVVGCRGVSGYVLGDSVRIAPRDDAPAQDELPGDGSSANDEAVGDPTRIDAVRSWLVSGIHLFEVDPRRRRGDHTRAKELLLVDSRESHDTDHWHKLAAALHRQTLQGALGQLRPDERRVVTLAYLDGLTNREIARAIGVSVSTVHRRLAAALESLETYISRSGAWLSAVALLLAGGAAWRGSRLGRSTVDFVGKADWPQKLAATLATGALATAALGVVSVTPDSATQRSGPHATVQVVLPAIQSVQASGSSATAPITVVLAQDRTAVSAAHSAKPKLPVIVSAPKVTVDADRDKGCDGKPTNAPPRVPVASKDSHPDGAPVTHPGEGGCRDRD